MTVRHPALMGPPVMLTMRQGNILTLIGMLAAVAGVLALTWLATRWIARRGAPGGAGLGMGGDERLKVLRMVTLGREERLALVQLGERCLLLGVTPSGVTLLRELTEEESAAWLAPAEDGTPAPPTFWDAVKQNLPKRK